MSSPCSGDFRPIKCLGNQASRASLRRLRGSVRLYKLNRITAILLTAVLLLGGYCELAAAQSHRGNRERCFRADTSSDPAAVIAACTDAISSGVISHRADFAFAYNNRAMAHVRAGDVQQGLADYDRAIALYPFMAGTFNNRALARASSGDYAGAIADLNEAIRLEPELAAAYYNRARFYSFGLRDHRRALTDYDRAIELAPERASYRTMACWHRAAFMQAEFDRALSDCNFSLQREPTNARLLTTRGLVQLHRGDFEAALTDYNAAVQIDPDLVHALYGRGIARLRLGQTAHGEADIAAALERNPTVATEFESYGIRR